MSQQKVDYHKEQKRNRRQIMKKEKAMRRLEITVLIAVLAALIIWFGYLVYRNTQAKYAASGANTVTMNLAPWENYTQNLDSLINGEETPAEEVITEEPAETDAEESEDTEETAETEAAEEEAAEEENTEETAEEEAAEEETTEEAAEEDTAEEAAEGNAETSSEDNAE